MFYKYSVKCCKDAIIALSLQLRAFLFYFVEKQKLKEVVYEKDQWK